ncbi:MAG: DUF4331 domain-containing protein [Gammaproteobacteria bacterium]
MKNRMLGNLFVVLIGVLGLTPGYLMASSHMDAPLITLDPAANTTDVYAFRSEQNGTQYLTTALAVYPFEEPGIGPNNYRFDDNVLYEIHLSLGDDVARGRKTISYRFQFNTAYKDRRTILQSYLGPLLGQTDGSGFDANQNLRQRYRVTKVMRQSSGVTTEVLLSTGRVPPNNQGLVTPFYNQGDDGEQPAREGVAAPSALDSYTQNAIFTLDDGTMVFAGQRDDGFYADIQSIFDLDFSFSGPNKPFDSQGGFNVHTIVLSVPLDQIEGFGDIVGVHATTSRRIVQVLGPLRNIGRGRFVQVGRQGNPLFNEALVGINRKDLYNRSTPVTDRQFFLDFALRPELARALGFPATNRQDIAGLFIPDLIKVDIGSGPVPLAGDADFHRLSVFGGDTVLNAQGTPVPGGFPNGRRFGDDVVDIALIALSQGAITGTDVDLDRVSQNDITYNRVFPYAATPLNGRNHLHH